MAPWREKFGGFSKRVQELRSLAAARLPRVPRHPLDERHTGLLAWSKPPETTRYLSPRRTLSSARITRVESLKLDIHSQAQ